jgi:hypothetical protein
LTNTILRETERQRRRERDRERDSVREREREREIERETERDRENIAYMLEWYKHKVVTYDSYVPPLSSTVNNDRNIGRRE